MSRLRIVLLVLFVFVGIAQYAVAGGGCGNGTCNGKETCKTCPADCGVCPPVCGDGKCQAPETCSTCAKDCGSGNVGIGSTCLMSKSKITVQL